MTSSLRGRLVKAMCSTLRPRVEGIAADVWPGFLGLVLAAFTAFATTRANAAAIERAAANRLFETGLPLFRNFSPGDYGAQTQNWAIVQDPRGVIYVANTDGVLEFDGRRWRLIRVANRTLVRSLAVGDQGRVYVGAVAELGYLQPDAAGALHYVSLLDRIPAEHRDFSDVWRTFATVDGAYFYTDQGLYRLRGEQLKVWKPASEYFMAFQMQQRLFVLEVGRGLLELVDDELRLLPEGERFADDRISTMLPAGDSAGQSGARRILIGTRSRGIHLFDGSTMQAWPTEVDAELKRDLLYCGIRLNDGRFLLGTLQAGLYLLDAQGRLLARLRKSDGLLDDTVLALFVDRQSAVWLALSRGIARVEIGQPITQFDERSGLAGTVLALHRHQGQLYAGTSQGLFKLLRGAPARFEALAGIATQSWAMLSVDQVMWVANNAGVYAVDGDHASLLWPSEKGALALQAVGVAPRRVFIGLTEGLASVRMEKGRWIEEGRIAGITDQVHSIAVSSDGGLWAGTGYTGVLRLRFPKGWRGGTLGDAPKVEHFGVAQGLPGLNHSAVFELGNEVLFATHQGIFRFDEGRQRFEADPRFATLFADGPRWVQAVRQGSGGRLWIWSTDEASGLQEAGAAVPHADGRYRWEARALKPLAGSQTESTLADADGVLWFGGGQGVFRYDPRVPKDYDEPFSARVRRVSGLDDRLIYGGSGDAAATALAYANSRLRFEYAAPSFDGLDANRFQVFLEGNDRGWSDWSVEGYQDYSNLFEGEYRFRVRAKNLYGRVSEQAVFAFRVLPPWYRTGWAYLGYLSLIGGLGWGLLRWRLKRLQAQKGALERTVAERTHQLATLGDIGREITAQLDLDAALDTLYVQLNRLLDAGVFGIGLHHPERGEIEFRLAIENGQRYQPYTRRMEDKNQLAVWCIEQRQSILIGDYPSECARYLAQPDDRTGPVVDGSTSQAPRSAMYVPLLLKGQVIGVLSVQSLTGHAYDRSHLDILQTLAAYTATAIDNAHAHNKLARSHEDLRATHRHLVEAQQQLVLQEKMASLGQLVAGVAHEINTPLGVALTASSHLGQQTRIIATKLERGQLTDSDLALFASQSVTVTDLIETNLGRAAKLVRSFKQVSVDRTNDDRRSFALAAYLRDLVQSLHPSWKRRPVALTVDCSESIRMDSFPGALGQVVTNLIQNSLLHAFAPDAGGTMVLTVRQPEQSRIELDFADDGCGIDAEHLPRIFDPFYTTRRGRGGTGLGLHITFNLVTQKLGGSIEALSEPGDGTRFRLKLPAVR